MTGKFLICAIVLFILTFGFCLVIGVIIKMANNKNDDVAGIVASILSVACGCFACACFIGTVIMTIFFIQSLLGGY